jgi:hypothetical protein
VDKVDHTTQMNIHFQRESLETGVRQDQRINTARQKVSRSMVQ